MTTHPAAEAAPAGAAASVATPLLIVLLSLAWIIGTPVLLFGAAIVAAPFFGELPSPAEVAEAKRLLAAGVACGIVSPAAALGTAWRARWKKTAWACGVALAISVTVTLAGFRMYLDDRADERATHPGPAVCQERSRGDATCPGG